MSTVPSPNMALPVPVVGEESGPQFAIDINACMSVVDAHDHSPGSGVQITPSGLNINADLTFSSHNAIDLLSVRLLPQTSPLSGLLDLNCISSVGADGNLYWNDANGNQIQITDNGGVAGTPGSIANLTSPASASYVALNETFVWQSDANKAATMDMRSAILRNSTTSSFGLTLQAPTLSADATQTLPQVPGAASFMTMASSGVMGTIPQSLGIVNSMIADDAIELRNMANNSVDTPELVDEAVTPAKMAPYNYSGSSGSGSFSTTSGSFVDVISAPITVSGLRPVLIVVNNYNNGNNPGFLSVLDAINVPVGILAINDSVAGDISITEVSTSAIGTTLSVPCGISFIHLPTAGTHTYKVRAKVISAGTTNFVLQNIQMAVYEL